MAGVSDHPYRTICREHGCSLFYTEMVSAKALYYENEKTDILLKSDPKEHPIGLQLFGSDPEILAREAKKMESQFDFIDLNLGCPVPKIVKNHEGSYLLTDVGLLREIFTALTEAVQIPVTVKMRKSFALTDPVSVKVAELSEECGISLIAVHGRSREEYYHGTADWDAIRMIKESVSIPVLGNGDVKTPFDAEKMLRETGCDGILIGRAARGNPWIFSEIRTYLTTGEKLTPPTLTEICETILHHARLLTAEKGEYIALREMRQHAAFYVAGKKSATEFRRSLNTVSTLSGLEKLLREFSQE